jgi:hypothetical protein
MRLNKKETKDSKVYLLPLFGRHKNKERAQLVEEEMNKSGVKPSKNEILGHGYKFQNKDSRMLRRGTLLGQDLHYKLERNTEQIKRILHKGRSAEARLAAKHLYGGKTIRLKAMEKFYTGAVESVLTTGLTLTQLDGRKDRYKKARVIQASVLKSGIGMGSRVSHRIAILEGGWTPIGAKIAAAKMRLHDRMMRLPDRSRVRQVMEVRNADCEEGDTKGLAAEVRGLWREAGRAELHTMRPGTKAKRNRDIVEAMDFVANKRMISWLEVHGGNNGHYDILYEGGAADHLQRGTKTEIALMCTARAGACLLRGNKTADKKATAADKKCRLCRQDQTEDETHILMECQTYGTQRADMLSDLLGLGGGDDSGVQRSLGHRKKTDTPRRIHQRTE